VALNLYQRTAKSNHNYWSIEILKQITKGSSQEKYFYAEWVSEAPPKIHKATDRSNADINNLFAELPEFRASIAVFCAISIGYMTVLVNI